MASLSPNKRSPPNGQSRRKSINGRFVLGIDVGTTSVKVCLVNVDTGEVSHKFVKDTLATAAKDLPNADLQVQSKFSFNPNWHETGRIYLLIIFESGFVS